MIIFRKGIAPRTINVQAHKSINGIKSKPAFNWQRAFGKRQVPMYDQVGQDQQRTTDKKAQNQATHITGIVKNMWGVYSLQEIRNCSWSGPSDHKQQI